MQSTNKGFSLIELMIVIAIVGTLAAIATPNYLNYINKTKMLSLISKAVDLETQVGEYANVHGVMPPTADAVYINTPIIDLYQIWQCPGDPNKIWIHVTPGNDIISYNATLILQGILNTNGVIQWTCGTHPQAPIPNQFLPATCQTVFDSTGC